MRKTPCLFPLIPMGAFLDMRMIKVEMVLEDEGYTLPEKVLAMAVLERALADICDPGVGVALHEKRAAEAWLFSDSQNLYSAYWWSEAAGSDYILTLIRQAAKEKRYKKPHGVLKQKNCGRNRSGKNWCLGAYD